MWSDLFPILKIVFFVIAKLKEFFMYFGCESFIRYVFFTYLFPVCSLYSDLLTISLNINVINFNEGKLTIFTFMNYFLVS